jgi:hypothetical protein
VIRIVILCGLLIVTAAGSDTLAQDAPRTGSLTISMPTRLDLQDRGDYIAAVFKESSFGDVCVTVSRQHVWVEGEFFCFNGDERVMLRPFPGAHPSALTLPARYGLKGFKDIAEARCGVQVIVELRVIESDQWVDSDAPRAEKPPMRRCLWTGYATGVFEE